MPAASDKVKRCRHLRGQAPGDHDRPRLPEGRGRRAGARFGCCGCQRCALDEADKKVEVRAEQDHRRPQDPGHVKRSRALLPPIDSLSDVSRPTACASCSCLSKLPGVGEERRRSATRSRCSSGDEAVPRDLGRALERAARVRSALRASVVTVAEKGFGRRGAGVHHLSRLASETTSILCVVARVQDLLAVERSGAMRGRYHVLGRLLSPLDGVTREGRAGRPSRGACRAPAKGVVREVLVATPPSVDGEATALLLSRELGSPPA
jgi:recombination protein RecR